MIVNAQQASLIVRSKLAIFFRMRGKERQEVVKQELNWQDSLFLFLFLFHLLYLASLCFLSCRRRRQQKLLLSLSILPTETSLVRFVRSFPLLYVWADECWKLKAFRTAHELSSLAREGITAFFIGWLTSRKEKALLASCNSRYPAWSALSRLLGFGCSLLLRERKRPNSALNRFSSIEKNWQATAG